MLHQHVEKKTMTGMCCLFQNHINNQVIWHQLARLHVGFGLTSHGWADKTQGFLAGNPYALSCRSSDLKAKRCSHAHLQIISIQLLKKKNSHGCSMNSEVFYQDTDLTAQHIARGDVVELKILKLTFSHSHKVVTTDSPGDFCTNFQLQHRCSVPGSFSC